MARLGIQYNDVKQAAFQLLSKGIGPSVQRIREKLGTGSNSTIAQHLQTWREEQATKNVHHLPATMPEELIAAMEVLWQTAMEQAVSQLSVTKETILSEKTKLQEERQQMESHMSFLQANAEKDKEMLTQTQAQCQQLKMELAVLHEKLHQQTKAFEMYEAQQENRLKKTYEEKETALESVKKYRQLLEKNQQQSEQEKEKQALAFDKERQRQEQSENRWLKLIDEARTESQHLKNLNVKQQKEISVLKETMSDFKQKKALSDTKNQALDKHNKMMNKQLTQLQKRYQSALEKISKMKKPALSQQKSLKNK